MTPKNKIKNLKATLEATNQQITIIPTVINIENQAVQDLYAQYRIRSIKNPKTREATLEAFVLKPCILARTTALRQQIRGVESMMKDSGYKIEKGTKLTHEIRAAPIRPEPMYPAGKVIY